MLYSVGLWEFCLRGMWTEIAIFGLLKENQFLRMSIWVKMMMQFAIWIYFVFKNLNSLTVPKPRDIYLRHEKLWFTEFLAKKKNKKIYNLRFERIDHFLPLPSRSFFFVFGYMTTGPKKSGWVALFDLIHFQ